MFPGQFLVQDPLENSREPSLPPNAHPHIGMQFQEVLRPPEAYPQAAPSKAMLPRADDRRL